MKDNDFEHGSRAHSFWSECQAAADRAGDPDSYPVAGMQIPEGMVIDEEGMVLQFPIPEPPEATSEITSVRISTAKHEWGDSESSLCVKGEIAPVPRFRTKFISKP